MEVLLSGRLRYKNAFYKLWRERYLLLYAHSQVLYCFRSNAELQTFLAESPGTPWRQASALSDDRRRRASGRAPHTTPLALLLQLC